jgi:hypothetical protein
MDRPRILFVALTNDLGSERVVSAMARSGIACGLLSPPDFYAAVSASVAARFALPSRLGLWRRALVARWRLAAAVRAWQPVAILPLDDVAARLLRGLALDPRVDARLRDLLVDSLGDPAGYEPSMSRRGLMDLAERLALPKPRHASLSHPDAIAEAAASWGLPLVLKEENTCGGCGVTIIHESGSIARASRPYAGRTAGLVQAAKRRLRSTLARQAGFGLPDGGADLIQSFVAGKPGMCAVAAWRGQVLGAACFIAEETHPAPTGSSTIVTPTANADMVATATKLVNALGCHGFVSFDFMVDESDRAYLIEMNARAIGVVSLSGLFGTDICGSVAAKFGAQVAPQRPLADGPRAVAQFPKELLRDPDSPYLRCASVFHDVPWHDAPLMRIYLSKVGAAHPDRITEIIRALSRAAGGTTPAAIDDQSLLMSGAASFARHDARKLPLAVPAVRPDSSVREAPAT